MSINRYKWHLYVLPEDDATKELANGMLQAAEDWSYQVQIQHPCGGWKKTASNEYLKETVKSYEMEKYSSCHLLLIIDFDGNEDRLETIKNGIESDPLLSKFKERIFVIGSLREVENLRRGIINDNDNKFGSAIEEVGKKLYQDCSLWQREDLKNSSREIYRLKAVLPSYP